MEHLADCLLPQLHTDLESSYRRAAVQHVGCGAFFRTCSHGGACCDGQRYGHSFSLSPSLSLFSPVSLSPLLDGLVLTWVCRCLNFEWFPWQPSPHTSGNTCDLSLCLFFLNLSCFSHFVTPVMSSYVCCYHYIILRADIALSHC